MQSTQVSNLKSGITLPPRHFIDLSDLTKAEFRQILELSRAIKLRRRTAADAIDRPLRGKKIVMVFEQPSLRTRMSFDVGIRELGGEPIMVTGREIELGERESIADTARVMSRFVDGIMIRMLDHAKLREFAENASVPVINGLTKSSHPCQVMADILTYEERKGPLAGATVAWVGDSNNVLTSWIHAAGKIAFTLRIATPEIYRPKPEILQWAQSNGAAIELTTSPQEAVKGADCIITDCWVSMGDAENEERTAALRPFQVDGALLRLADPGAIVMHCLPATRGEEITDEVMDGPQSAVFDEAENRLHAQKGIMAFLFG
ncbi:MAG: ornithine carbamoyltransferase [Beijerinckiaceae bacterium]|nr:ornithine carbamoyltransferase [Beijerinckiaceae bacterium]